jgi:hypothetical protein
LAPDLPLDVRRRGLLAGLRLDTRAGCVSAYERLLRAAVGGMVTPNELRLAVLVVRGAAELYMERRPPAGERARASRVKADAIAASRADPEAQPDPVDDPEPDPEPTFEDEVEAAARRRALRAGGA